MITIIHEHTVTCLYFYLLQCTYSSSLLTSACSLTSTYTSTTYSLSNHTLNVYSEIRTKHYKHTLRLTCIYVQTQDFVEHMTK